MLPPMARSEKLVKSFQRTLRRDFWITFAPATLAVVGAFAIAFHFVKPAPPKKLVLATGQDEGGFRFYSKKYAEFLKKHDIELEVRATDGSVENLKLLADDASGVDVAFVQGGTVFTGDTSRIVSLGALSFVPIWVFYKGDEIADLGGLKGKRIALGSPQSGTHALAEALLKANGAVEGSTLLPMERKEAIEKLTAGEIDALFAVAPAEAPALQKLAAVPGVHLLSFTRADAYTRKFPALTKLVLPRGVFNLATNLPADDVTLLSPTANLVTRNTLHPALAYLLMRAASEIHGSAGLLDKAGEFPSALDGGFTLSDEAKRYYKSGSPLLQRYLPFWAANLVDRLWVMLVPIIAVAVPLIRLVPPIYRWRVRSRIYRWYARLKEIELQLEDAADGAALEGMLAKLEEVERAVNRIPTPLSYSENLYSFRQHLDLVRRRIAHRLSVVAEPKRAA